MAKHFHSTKFAASSTPDIRVVYVQATESSTGARHDVEAIARRVRKSGDDTLLVVDAITGLGTTRFDVDGWGIDVIIGGSQKALMIPPGLAYCAVSERAWKRMETAKSPRYYFDFRKERKAAAKGESAFTPATSLFAALGAALDFVRQMGNGSLVAGRAALIDNAELAAEMTRAGAKALGLELFAPTCPAAALTAIQCAPAAWIRARWSSNSARTSARSWPMVKAEMKGKLFRIAHLGYYDYLDTIGILAALEHVMAGVHGRAVEYGSAVRAAQEVYAKDASARVRSKSSTDLHGSTRIIMKIVVAEKISASAVDLLREPRWVVVTPENMEGGLAKQLESADALIVRSAVQVNAELLSQARKLRVIGRAGVGVDNIELDPATRQGIAVMNTPGANAVAVAEHTLAMMLAMARHLCRANELMHAGKWEKKSLQGTELRGKTLGIVGLGRVGMEVARRARAFGMEIVAHDPFVSVAGRQRAGDPDGEFGRTLRGCRLCDPARRPDAANHGDDQCATHKEDETGCAAGELRARRTD